MKQGNKMVAQIQVGDVIKSLDFPGTDTCYMIGKVVAIFDNGQVLNCKAIVKVWEGKAEIVTNAHDFAVPIEGLQFMDERFPGRITLVA
jgi:hypothetical protein